MSHTHSPHSPHPRHTAIIGAGIGGLATAIRLRAQGHRVVVFEKEERVGGKLMEFQRDGFRFDMGPSLFTQPERVEELFTLLGENPHDHLSYDRLDTVCVYHFSDGSVLRVPSEAKDFLEEVRAFSRSFPGEDERLNKYLEISKQLYEGAAPLFIERPFPTREGMLSAEGQAIGKRPWLLDPFISMHQRNQRAFSDARLIQLFDRYATYNGSDPYQAPATLKMIAHLEHNLGAYFPHKGMYGVAGALHDLALRHGVEFRTGLEVLEIVTNVTNKQVEGIRHRDGFEAFDIVVSDLDVHTLYRTLLKGISPPPGSRKPRLSTSAIIFYWGIQGVHSQVDLHNILFSADYRAEFKAIFRQKRIADDPTIYIFVSSKQVASDAPAGSENWFVMVNTPENTGQNWDDEIARLKLRILEKVHQALGIDLTRQIQVEHIEDPRTIESRTGSYLGALYGNNSNSRLSAFSRHPNHRKIIKNMYFVGGSVHPGGGIPLCLASAKIVANLIINQQPITSNQ